MIARVQMYQGGVSAHRFTVDGSAVGGGAALAASFKIGDADSQHTTSAKTVIDFATIATAGAHTLRYQAKSSNAGPTPGRLRYINSEGPGQIIAFAIH